jgi:glycosyltransferase involved in cell wall biosynthesis
MIKLLKVVTTFQSVITILDSKLFLLEKHPDIDLHVVSSFEDQQEQRTAKGKFTQVNIARTISPIQDLSAIIKLYRFIKAEHFDVVHTHTAKAGIVGAIAAKLAGVPLICHTYHGLPFYKGQKPLPHFIYKTIEIAFSKIRHILFSQNKYDYEQLKSIKSIKCPVIFEGNGVSISDIVSNAARDALFVEQYFSSSPDSSLLSSSNAPLKKGGQGGLVVLCLARLEPVKRLEKVLGAMEYLLANKINAQCFIAGKGHLEKQLKELIQSKGLADHVSIVYTPYVHALINKADIAILTSEKEGIPRGLMEAMALGKPVVATNVLGTNELVVDQETGFLVPLEDQEAFNRCLLQLATDASLRQKFGQAGRARIASQFDDAKIVQLWVKTYAGRG